MDTAQVTPEYDDILNSGPNSGLHADDSAADAPRSVRGHASDRIRWAVEIRDEDSTADGWVWNVRLHPADASGHPEAALPESRTIEVRMSWVDHDHLCHGRLAPSEAVARILRHAVACMPAAKLPSRMDVAHITRVLTKLGGVDHDTADLGRLFQREC